jgi:C1A family cysteine protease
MCTIPLPDCIRRSLIAVTALFACLLPAGTVQALDLGTVQEAIRLSGARWVAADTAVNRLSEAQKAQLTGLLPEPESAGAAPEPLFRALAAAPLPTRLDWRDIDGDNYVSVAKHQELCGACWAFAAVGALESYVMLRTHSPGLDIDLAEQFLLSCETTGGCGGGSGWTAASILHDTGVPEEACLPYTADDASPCSQRCGDWEQQLRTISGFEQLFGNTGGLSQAEIVDTLKSAVATYGPLWTSMQVYDDFYAYGSGIYAYTSGGYRGGHAVILIGFDDAAECFIVKNSWGRNWGESGTFRIAYGEVTGNVEFGAYTYTYGDPVELGPEAPTADAGADLTVDEGDHVSLDGSGSSDPDGQIDSYQWRRVSGPAVGLTGSDTVQPGFTAPNLSTPADADLLFELTVTDDDELTASDRVTVTVTWSNDAPTARAGADRSVAEGASVALNGANSQDPEGESLSYRWQKISGPNITLDDTSKAEASFTAPNLTTAGDAQLVFELTVTDPSGASDSDRVTITVTWENDAPTANAGDDRTVDEGAAVQLDGSASRDREGAVAGYQWRQTGGPPVQLTRADTAQAGFDAPNLTSAADAELVFELTVTDAHGDTGTDSVRVTVAWENDAPTALAGDDQTVAPGEAVTLDAAASSDPDDGINAYAWTQVAGPDIELATSTTANTSFTAPDYDGEAPLQLSFELTVSDHGGLSATDRVDIWVTANPADEDPQIPPPPADSDDSTPPADLPKDEAGQSESSGGGGGGGCFLSVAKHGFVRHPAE